MNYYLESLRMAPEIQLQYAINAGYCDYRLPSGWFLIALGKNQALCLPLTCQADHGEANEQVQRQCPAFRHVGGGEGNDDFRRDVELQGVGAQDSNDVEDLDWLVQPAGQTRAVLWHLESLYINLWPWNRPVGKRFLVWKWWGGTTYKRKSQ